MRDRSGRGQALEGVDGRIDVDDERLVADLPAAQRSSGWSPTASCPIACPPRVGRLNPARTAAFGDVTNRSGNASLAQAAALTTRADEKPTTVHLGDGVGVGADEDDAAAVRLGLHHLHVGEHLGVVAVALDDQVGGPVLRRSPVRELGVGHIGLDERLQLAAAFEHPGDPVELAVPGERVGPCRGVAGVDGLVVSSHQLVDFELVARGQRHPSYLGLVAPDAGPIVACWSGR